MNKEQRYREWKSSYLLRHKKQKRIYLLKIGIGIIVIILLYSWYTGRLIFFAQPTDHTTGAVTKTKPWKTAPIGGFATYIQHATYTYTIDGKKYEEGFFPTKSVGRLHEGDSLNVQYSLFFNGISKVIEIHHCPHNN